MGQISAKYTRKHIISSKMEIEKASCYAHNAIEIMNVINDAYFNEKDQKLWKTGEQQLRISSVEQVKEMIPDMFVARNKTSKEITGVVVAKIFNKTKRNGGIIVEIGPLAVRKTFQV